MLILSITSVFMYEGSIFMVILNFVPFIMDKKQISLSKILFSSLIFVIAFIYLSFNFRNFNVVNPLPANFHLTKGGNLLPIDIPYLFIQTFPNVLWYILFLIPLTACVLYEIYLFKGGLDKRISFIFMFFTILSLINLYGIIFIAFLIFYLLRWIKFEDLRSKKFFYLVGIMIFNFVFYLIYSLMNNSWIVFFPGDSSVSIRKIFWVLINYPNFFEKIFLPWFLSMPKFMLMAILLIGGSLLIYFYKSWRENDEEIIGSNFLLAIIIFLISLVAVLTTPYNDVRYTFFIYPIILLVILLSMKDISKFITRRRGLKYSIFFMLLIIFIGLSSDYYSYHLLHISSREVRFRTIYEHRHANIYYYQEDYVTPAEIINKNLNDSDIVITTQTPVEYYLKRLNYEFLDYRDAEFPIRSRQNGEEEVWTNAKIIYSEKALLSLLKNSKYNIWLVDFSKRRYGVSPLEIEINKKYKKDLYYVNLDSTVNVFRISTKK